jgi:hypothetical protein
MRIGVVLRSLMLCIAFIGFSYNAFAQISVGISVRFGPPPIPVYEQPICPAEGYLWVPGYWAYDDEFGYYWVPGTWVEAPQVGFLWTPGYWGWGGTAFIFHQGYWGPHVGFYGGINYGFGYGGVGYEGGRWQGNRFSYNTYVNRVNTTIIHNTYNVHVTNITETRISYNGGNGGVQARPTPQEESYSNERRLAPVAAQTQHVQMARGNPELRATANQGKPPIAATARPANFTSGIAPARQAGGEYKAPPPNAAHGSPPGANPAAYRHASELQPHVAAAPNTGDPALDKRYQQQQENLAAKQDKEHQKLQQQQEKQHQQAAQKNYNDAQKQAMEQRHAQQTQQLVQKHAAEQQHLEQTQASHQPAPKPEGHPPAEKH